MKKILLLCMALLVLNVAAVNAASAESGTAGITSGDMNVGNNVPRVMLMYLNNAKTDYNNEIDIKVMDSLGKIADKRWQLTRGDVYKDKLSGMGIQSFTMAERGDILAITKQAEADVILLVEIEPFNVRDVVTFFTVGKKVTATVPVKVIDCNTGLYVYNGKFVEMGQDNSMIGGIGNKSVIMKALDQVFDKFGMVIPDKISATKIKSAS